MKEKIIATFAYSLIIGMLIAIAAVVGIISHQITHKDHKSRYVEKIIEIESICSPEIKKETVEKIVYRDRIVYKDKIVYVAKPNQSVRTKKMTYGVTLVGASLNSIMGRKLYYGFGVKVQYDHYFSTMEVLENNSFLLSLGYEF